MRVRKAGKVDYDVSKGVPAVIIVIDEESLKLLQTGQQKLALKREDEDRPYFMDFLHEWRSEWMWEGLCLNKDPEWVDDCLLNNTLVCITDGSYNKKTAPDICSAG